MELGSTLIRSMSKKTSKHVKPINTEIKSKDTSPKIHQRSKIDFNLLIQERDDLTERQKVILETMLDKKTRCVFIDGIYGTGKTYCAVLAALKLLNAGRVDQILYIRNPIENSSTGKVGFLPGSISEKMSPYAAVMAEKLEEFISKNDIITLTKQDRIESMPLGFVRGRSWNCKAIIVDEASSMTYDDLVLLMTRCGEFTRIFLVGDSLNQNDIGSKSGFRQMFNIFDDMDSKENGVYTFELREESDIVRSGFLRFILKKMNVIKRS